MSVAVQLRKGFFWRAFMQLPTFIASAVKQRWDGNTWVLFSVSFFVWLPNNTRVISWENFPRVFRTVEGKHTIMQIYRHDDNNSPPALLKLVALLSFLFQEHAFENSQKYKEGKFIIEMAHMIKDNGWE